jgi:plastocyanin
MWHRLHAEFFLKNFNQSPLDVEWFFWSHFSISMDDLKDRMGRSRLIVAALFIIHREMMKNIFAMSTVFAFAWGLIGCASKSAYTGPEPAAVVVMHMHSFEPATTTIKAGQTVRWNNTSIIWHTVTDDAAMAKDPAHVALPAGAEAFDSGKVEAGSNWWHTFSAAGTYRYICKPHESKGMIGTVVVEPGK